MQTSKQLTLREKQKQTNKWCSRVQITQNLKYFFLKKKKRRKKYPKYLVGPKFISAASSSCATSKTLQAIQVYVYHCLTRSMSVLQTTLTLEELFIMQLSDVWSQFVLKLQLRPSRPMTGAKLLTDLKGQARIYFSRLQGRT